MRSAWIGSAALRLTLTLTLTLFAPAAMGDTPRPPVQPPVAAVPVAAAPAAAAPATPEPVVEPPYDPGTHQGLSEAAWLRATRGTGRRSIGMMLTGVGFVSLGGALLAAGTGVYFNDNGCQAPSGASIPCGPGQTTGIALLSAGLIALGLGLPLTLYGAAEVPRFESGSVSRAAPAFPRVSVGLGLRGAAVALHF